MIVGTAALSLISPPIAAQDYAAVQSANTEVLLNLIKSLKGHSVSGVSGFDSVIDYAPNRFSSSSISPEQMVAMFEGCAPKSMKSARRFSDTTILNFVCAGRKVEGQCSTGELQIMIYRQPELSIGVMEDQRIGPDCKTPTPPPVSSGAGGLN